MPRMGPRIRLQTWLPADDFREIAKRAAGRGWTMSAYLRWLVAKEIRPDKGRGHHGATVRRRATEFPSPYLEAVDDG